MLSRGVERGVGAKSRITKLKTEESEELDACMTALLVEFHEHSISRIPDLTSSLLDLLQYPGLDSARCGWWPVKNELPMPAGVGSALLPLVRQIQDQYLNELQLRKHPLPRPKRKMDILAQATREQRAEPVTVSECTLHLEALTSKFDGVRHWLKQLYADWIENIVTTHRLQQHPLPPPPPPQHSLSKHAECSADVFGRAPLSKHSECGWLGGHALSGGGGIGGDALRAAGVQASSVKSHTLSPAPPPPPSVAVGEQLELEVDHEVDGLWAITPPPPAAPI